jgi:hypothetical protein
MRPLPGHVEPDVARERLRAHCLIVPLQHEHPARGRPGPFQARCVRGTRASLTGAYLREVGARLGHATRAATRGPEGILRTSVFGSGPTPHRIVDVPCPARPAALPAGLHRPVRPRGVPSTSRTADDPASDSSLLMDIGGAIEGWPSPRARLGGHPPPRPLLR